VATVVISCTSSTTPDVACGPDHVATTNWDVVATTNDEAAYFWAAADPIPASAYGSGVVATAVVVQESPIGADTQQAAMAASAVAAAVGNYFPNGCATATADQNIVTFTLANCTGPLGLSASSGTITATITTGNNQVQVQLAGNGISANGATINLSTMGTISLGANGQKTLQGNSQSTGAGPYGNSFSHLGAYTLVWPTSSGCGTINAQFSGVGSGAYSGAGTGTYYGTTTRITNYVACAGKCPQSGTTTSAFTGQTVTLTFNGSSNAQCTSSTGDSATIPLHCG
jgi:hypothetical protein